MRQALKNIEIGPVEFIPKAMAEDQSLSKTAKEIKNRPLVIMVRKMTREDRYNIRGLLQTETRGNDEVAVNIGSVSRYIWNKCVVEVLNVLLGEGEFESLKGRLKDELFDTEGIDGEIMECIRFIQDISSLNESEVKNSN
jgi:hypothetical protein